MISFFFFFNDTATTEIYTLSLHDALPICVEDRLLRLARGADHPRRRALHGLARPAGSRLAARAVLPLRRVRRGGAARLAVPPQPAAVRPAVAHARRSHGAALRRGPRPGARPRGVSSGRAPAAAISRGPDAHRRARGRDAPRPGPAPPHPRSGRGRGGPRPDGARAPRGA